MKIAGYWHIRGDYALNPDNRHGSDVGLPSKNISNGTPIWRLLRHAHVPY